MKILIDKYPMGTITGQKTPGRYINETLYENIKLLAKTIVKDMTFLGVMSSSTLENGTGKSVHAQQIGEAFQSCVNSFHGTKLEFTGKNLVFKPEDLIKRAFEVPKYSVLILDEWEDQHYWSKLGISLRQFFRKCRQLNLFIIIIIPNFFQLPINYAVSRSVFFIDVQFKGEFDRGYFSFYNFENKKFLYLKGKKNHDYGVVRPNFTGRFASGYVLNEEEYRRLKYKDMMDDTKEKKVLTEREIRIKLFRQIHERLPDLQIYRLAEAFSINPRTATEWLRGDKEQFSLEIEPEYRATENYKVNPMMTKPDVGLPLEGEVAL